MEYTIPFAKSNKTGRMVSVFEVEKGLACDCICPKCRVKVEACKGPKRFYFRHQKSQLGSYICENAKESAIHEMAKQIFTEIDSFWLPEKTVDYGNQAGGKRTYRPSRWFKIRNVGIEKWQDKLKPDITVSDGTETIYVEIFVTHKVDDNKKKKVLETNIPMLEIDLSILKEYEISEINELRKIIIGQNTMKHWVFFDKESFEFERKLEESRKQYIRKDGDQYEVQGCPLNPFINDTDNLTSWEYCKNCEFASDIVPFEGMLGGYITCTAELGGSLKNRELSIEDTHKRINNERDERIKRKEEADRQRAEQDKHNREDEERRRSEIEAEKETLRLDRFERKKKHDELVSITEKKYHLIQSALKNGDSEIPYHLIELRRGKCNTCLKNGKPLYASPLPRCLNCNYCGYFKMKRDNSEFKVYCCYPVRVSYNGPSEHGYIKDI